MHIFFRYHFHNHVVSFVVLNKREARPELVKAINREVGDAVDEKYLQAHFGIEFSTGPRDHIHFHLVDGRHLARIYLRVPFAHRI